MNFSPYPKLFVCIIVATTLAGCQEPAEPSSAIATIQFSQNALALSESSDGQLITINFDRPAAAGGEIVLKVTSTSAHAFTTEPAADHDLLRLEVAARQKFIQFTLRPDNNTALDGNKVVSISIVTSSSHLRPGITKDIQVIIADDESPATANFMLNMGTVRENNANGLRLSLALSAPAPADGMLIVAFGGGVYGTDFITEPAAIGGQLFVPVATGAGIVSFKIYPVNNDTRTGDRQIGFEVKEATGGVALGEQVTFALSIVEDEAYNIVSVNSVRVLYQGEQFFIPGATYLLGTVTSVDNVIPGRVVVEDESGALPVQLIITHDFKRGDKVRVNLEYGIIRQFQGVLEVAQVSEAEMVESGDVTCRNLSLEEVYNKGNSLQSQTVIVDNLHFTQADGVTPMLGDRTATDGTRNIVIRTQSFASFRNQPVPSGTLSIRGILTRVDNVFYLYPQEFDRDLLKQK